MIRDAIVYFRTADGQSQQQQRVRFHADNNPNDLSEQERSEILEQANIPEGASVYRISAQGRSHNILSTLGFGLGMSGLFSNNSIGYWRHEGPNFFTREYTGAELNSVLAARAITTFQENRREIPRIGAGAVLFGYLWAQTTGRPACAQESIVYEFLPYGSDMWSEYTIIAHYPTLDENGRQRNISTRITINSYDGIEGNTGPRLDQEQINGLIGLVPSAIAIDSMLPDPALAGLETFRLSEPSLRLTGNPTPLSLFTYLSSIVRDSNDSMQAQPEAEPQQQDNREEPRPVPMLNVRAGGRYY